MQGKTLRIVTNRRNKLYKLGYIYCSKTDKHNAVQVSCDLEVNAQVMAPSCGEQVAFQTEVQTLTTGKHGRWEK